MDASVFALISEFKKSADTRVVDSTDSLSNSERDKCKESVTGPHKDVSLGLLIFSKDRPFQLLQLLLSIDEYVSQYPDKVVVLYTCSDPSGEWFQHYQSISHKFATRVELHLETDFSSNLLDILKNDFDTIDIVGFCVDDLLFISPTPLHLYANDLLNSKGSSSPFAFHTKLHPGICYSHTKSEMCVVPNLTLFYKSSYTGVESFVYSLVDGTGEWHYPFDLCGSLYRKKDILNLLDIACSRDDLGPHSFRNPNLLETTGNKIFWQTELSRNFQTCLCATMRNLIVLTVNRVQTTFDVPIYETEGGDICSLNSNFSIASTDCGHGGDLCDKIANTRAYCRAPTAMSVHVGGLQFLSSQDRLTQTKDESGAVSLLIPVYNGDRYLESTLRSVIDQPQGCKFEVVVVDDGSTDRTRDILEKMKSRANNKGIPFNFVTLESNKGLIYALEEGLKLCSHELIARLDADDLVESYRLCRQRAFLDANQGIHVVGSQALHIDSSALEPPRLVKGVPTHPVIVAWELMFRCCLLHPSVMFRRSVILECGSYEFAVNTAPAAEDYDLWCRILRKYPLALANLPDVLVRLRRHEASKSSMESVQMLDQSRKLRYGAVSRLLGRDFSFQESNLDVLAHPEKFLMKGDEVRPALSLLDAMHEAFLRRYPLDEHYGEPIVDGDTKLMLKKALQKSKKDKQERLCAAAIQKGVAGDMPEELREMMNQAEVRALKAQIAALCI